MKDEKISINNQDVYLIVKGSAFLTTEFYSMIISEGSVINTSVLLDLALKDVNIKAMSDCLIVKLILDDIYLRKEDEMDFVQRIEEIEHKISGFNYARITISKYKSPNSNQKSSELRTWILWKEAQKKVTLSKNKESATITKPFKHNLNKISQLEK